MQGKKHYSEKLFKQFQLSDRVPADNFYRRLKEMLELRWLYKATKNYYGAEGQQSIDPVVFFKLMLIGNSFELLGMMIENCNDLSLIVRQVVRAFDHKNLGLSNAAVI